MTPLAAIARFTPEIAGERLRLTWAAVLLLIAAALDALGVFVLSDVVDGALNASVWQDFAKLAMIWLFVTAFSTVTEYFGTLIAAGVSERVVLRLRTRVFAHVQKLSPLTHRRRGLGDLTVRHSSDLEALEHLISSGLLALVIAVVNIAGLLIAAYLMNPLVATVAVCAVPLLWGVSSMFGAAQRRVTRDERGASSDIADAIQTALTGHETTVAYNRQEHEASTLHRHGRRWARARIRQTRVEGGFGAVMGFTEVVVTLIVTITGVWQVRLGQLTVGQLVALTGYLAMLYPKLQDLAEIRLSVASAAVSAERVAELLDEPAHLADPPGARPAVVGNPRVELSQVRFHRGDRAVLDGVDLRLEPGSITALTGPSGAGKSTLAALLTRMESPDDGQILLDGNDIGDATGSSIRDLVTLLPQTPVIKAGTVADNIAYGRGDASREQIVAAAIDAEAHDFITALPAGYDTELSSEGLELSGGQRQRLCIARAILRNSPVLVLDEPSAALDPQSVAGIVAPLRRLAAGRTTLLITHDHTMAAMADRVVTLRDGRLEPVTTARRPRGRHAKSLQLQHAERVVDDGAEVQDAVALGDAGHEGVVDALRPDVVHDLAVEAERDHPHDVLRRRADAVGHLREHPARPRRQSKHAFQQAVSR
ncbi:MAG: ABC transporter ATP-binding protein [Gordonia sp. (in: high G+C Gram-positive bacteria)]